MRRPDLLATRHGRLAAFFFLYLTEGIPLGFTATAIATQMRRQGLSPAQIGAFVASLYLPWAWKWAIGPFVDVLSSDRWGRRRTWIVLAQLMMAGTLLAAVKVDFVTELALFTTLILVHNSFGATQDVAIDALACSVLSEGERGLANGLMFAGAYLGQAVGGAGVLYLSDFLKTRHGSSASFGTTFFFVAAAILAVTVFVALPLREAKAATGLPAAGSALARAGREIAQFARDALRAITGTRAASVGLLFALLPAGAYAMGLAVQSNLAVELGLRDSEIASLQLWSTILSAAGCVLGGFLSDRLGRRRMLALYLLGTAIPTIYLAARMRTFGWIMPTPLDAPDRPGVPAALVAAFWIATLSYAVFQGLMYGARMALFMDVTTPAVAATQFTAYMALSNLAIAYSARWQGAAVERWGYPTTLVLDAVLGLACIACLPLMRRAAPAGVRAS